MSQAFWTNARIDQLRDLNTEGLSGQQIAEVIGGTTRNAVIGKLHRLGIVCSALRKIEAHKRNNASRGGRTRQKPKPLALVAALTFGNLSGPTVPKAPARIDITDAEREGGLRIIDPGFRGCRWPLSGDGSEMRFCCAGVADGPYCGEHKRRAHTSKIQLTPEEIKSTERLFQRAS